MKRVSWQSEPRWLGHMVLMSKDGFKMHFIRPDITHTPCERRRKDAFVAARNKIN